MKTRSSKLENHAPGSLVAQIHFLILAQSKQALPYKLFSLISETAKSQARAVSAMYVSDGFTQEEETMQAPSGRKRFLMSCA